jgi:hypothetical protein
MKKIVYLLILCCLPAIAFTQAKPKKARSAKYGFRPELIRGPYLQAATPGSMMVRWRTDEPDVSFVHYGAAPGNTTLVAGDSTLKTEHMVMLTGLEPQTRYYYMLVGTKDTLQGDERNYFLTLPVTRKTDKYRIGVFGDCGNNSTNQRNTRDQFEKYLGNHPLNAWILLGDNAYSFGKDAEFQSNFFNIYKDNLLKNAPLFPAPGNHDYHDEPYNADYAQQSKEIAYYQIFSMPANGEAGGVPSHTQAFYSFDIGNIHFLSLDSHGTEDNASRLYDTLGRQVRWIKEDLEANKNKDWVIAYWHHPPYSMGSHNSDTEEQLVKIRENFIRILERYGVDLILCGHSHSYERSKLMGGHYGPENSFNTTQHDLSTSSAMYNGGENSCPYIKNSTEGKGTVYVVSGSAGQLGGQQTTFPHDALPFSDVTHGGACMLEVEANRLDLKWICADGVIRDRFTMMKDVNRKTVIQLKKGEKAVLKASYVGAYTWSGTKANSRSITVSPPPGRSVYTVRDPENCLQDEFIVNVTK